MKQETAKKLIWKAINKEKLTKLATKEKVNEMFNIIYTDFVIFENDDSEYSSSENLKYAIDIWLNSGDKTIKDIYCLK